MNASFTSLDGQSFLREGGEMVLLRGETANLLKMQYLEDAMIEAYASRGQEYMSIQSSSRMGRRIELFYDIMSSRWAYELAFCSALCFVWINCADACLFGQRGSLGTCLHLTVAKGIITCTGSLLARTRAEDMSNCWWLSSTES